MADCLIRCPERGRCCWCAVCGHRRRHRRMAGCQVAPVSVSLFPFPLPVPNSHFPQFPFPSRVSNNFAVGGLKRARRIQRIHTHIRNCVCLCVCLYCMCCIHAPDDGFIAFLWHCPCPVASNAPSSYLRSTNKTELRLDDDGHSIYLLGAV